MQDFLGGITPQYWLFYVGLVLVLLVLFVRGGIIGLMMALREKVSPSDDKDAGGRK
jgi:branched-chain amino acid transport system permease protein